MKHRGPDWDRRQDFAVFRHRRRVTVSRTAAMSCMNPRLFTQRHLMPPRPRIAIGFRHALGARRGRHRRHPPSQTGGNGAIIGPGHFRSRGSGWQDRADRSCVGDCCCYASWRWRRRRACLGWPSARRWIRPAAPSPTCPRRSGRPSDRISSSCRFCRWGWRWWSGCGGRSGRGVVPWRFRPCRC